MFTFYYKSQCPWCRKVQPLVAQMRNYIPPTETVNIVEGSPPQGQSVPYMEYISNGKVISRVTDSSDFSRYIQSLPNFFNNRRGI